MKYIEVLNEIAEYFSLSSVVDDEAVLMQFLQEHSKYDNTWNVGNGKINININQRIFKIWHLRNITCYHLMSEFYYPLLNINYSILYCNNMLLQILKYDR